MHLKQVSRQTGHTRRAPLREFSDHILDELYPLLRRALSSAGPYAIWDANLYRSWYLATQIREQVLRAQLWYGWKSKPDGPPHVVLTVQRINPPRLVVSREGLGRLREHPLNDADDVARYCLDVVVILRPRWKAPRKPLSTDNLLHGDYPVVSISSSATLIKDD